MMQIVINDGQIRPILEVVMGASAFDRLASVSSLKKLENQMKDRAAALVALNVWKQALTEAEPEGLHEYACKYHITEIELALTGKYADVTSEITELRKALSKDSRWDVPEAEKLKHSPFASLTL